MIWSVQTNHTTSHFLKAVFHKFYLVQSWIHCLIHDWGFTYEWSFDWGFTYEWSFLTPPVRFIPPAEVVHRALCEVKTRINISKHISKKHFVKPCSSRILCLYQDGSGVQKYDLRYLLEDFWNVLDHFGTSRIKGLSLYCAFPTGDLNLKF